jgi:hypothetical protein
MRLPGFYAALGTLIEAGFVALSDLHRHRGLPGTIHILNRIYRLHNGNDRFSAHNTRHGCLILILPVSG